MDIALILSAFAFGFRHGIDWDHIAAITDITSSQRSVRTGLRYATLYAGGHAVVVFLIGILAIVAGESLPDSIDTAMGRVVGATLLILGVYVLYALIRYRDDFRMRSRWMLIFQSARNAYRWVTARVGSKGPPLEHSHEHADDELHHDGDEHIGGGGVAVRTKIHFHTHTHDPFMNYGTGTSLAVGALHGVGAETPTQVLIFLAAVGVGILGSVAALCHLRDGVGRDGRRELGARRLVRPRQGRLAARLLRGLAGSAGFTETDDREVATIDLEAELSLEHPQKVAQLRSRQLLDSFAPLADEVLVCVVGTVIDRAAVPEVDEIDHAELLERLERPVDGRDVHRRKPLLNPARDLIRGQVAPGREDRFDDRLARGRAPSAVGGEPAEDAVDLRPRWCNHLQLQLYALSRLTTKERRASHV